MSHSNSRTSSYLVTRFKIEGPELRSANRWEVSPGGRQNWGKPDRQPGDLSARQEAVDLAGDVALQDADDLMLGLSFFDATLEVELCLGVMGDAHHDDAPQRAVGLAVSAIVSLDPAARLAGPLWDGRHAAQVGPGRF